MKSFSAKLKKVRPLLISSQQSAYVTNRCRSKSRKPIFDLTDVTEKLKSTSYSVKIDIEKAFDYLDHSFLLTALENFSSGINFIDWNKIFLKDQ